MKVFISWSGKESSSFRVAQKLYEILPLIFQNNEYFFSNHIHKGTFALSEIFDNLADAKIGIFCVTKNNISKPWLNFEAGAISSTVTRNEGLTIPLLIDITKDEFASSPSPLSNFQATDFTDEQDFLQMLMDIGNAVGSPLTDKQIDKLFNQNKGELYNCDLSSMESFARNDTPIQPNVKIELDAIYKTTIDSEDNYLFKLNFYNSSNTTFFITDMYVTKTDCILAMEKEEQDVITVVKKRNNIETQRTALRNYPIPFKLLKEDLVSGFFYLCDKQFTMQLRENDVITISANLGFKIIEDNFVVSNIRNWSAINVT